MTLLVSAKNQKDVQTACRQIENWANGIAPVAISNLASGSTGTAQAILDPFGFVHLEGSITWAGNISAAGYYLIATLPNPFWPISTKVTSINFWWDSSVAYASFLVIDTNGTMYFYSTAALGSGSTVEVFLTGVTYYPKV